jgi:hypothetical protein
VSSPRRRTIWLRYNTNPTIGANVQFVTFNPLTDLFQAAGGGGLLGCTVTRIRGMIVATNSTLVGIGVLGFKVTDSSAALTVADTPLSDSNGREDDWLGYVPFTYRPALNSPEAIMFDVKGQRRMDERGMGLVGVIDVGNLASATGIAVVTSVLITLP